MTEMPRHVVSVDQFDTGMLDHLFCIADEMKQYVKRGRKPDPMRERAVANLFYEPSTRTSLSFSIAAQKLGMQVYSVDDVQFSSMAKGETLEDTIRVVSSMVDLIVLRHPDPQAAERAVQVSGCPVVNAGCGDGEHPTQALLDMYTIRNESSLRPGLNVGLAGDLRNGRTVHSLVKLLRLYEARLCLFSPPVLALPEELMRSLDVISYHLPDFMDMLDVLYVTRIQRDRLEHQVFPEEGVGFYHVTPELMKLAKSNMILMHPLPRLEEIHRDVDVDPRAVYFKQAENGLYMRMALLWAMLA